jgi:hypothetical protein
MERPARRLHSVRLLYLLRGFVELSNPNEGQEDDQHQAGDTDLLPGGQLPAR